MDEPPAGSPADPRPPDDSWADLSATTNQALEWGIDLCGQLATVHADGVVVGDISAATIRRGRFGKPQLPEPRPDCADEPWVDVAALADAIGAIVTDPPPELRNALAPPYASAVALGQELQDAQRAMGLPVAPIPFEGAPEASVGGEPPEVPPSRPDDEGETSAERPADEALDVDLDFDPAELARNPNMRALLVIAIVVALLALALGIGWR